jgi:hypothetical protein
LEPCGIGASRLGLNIWIVAARHAGLVMGSRVEGKAVKPSSRCTQLDPLGSGGRYEDHSEAASGGVYDEMYCLSCGVDHVSDVATDGRGLCKADSSQMQGQQEGRSKGVEDKQG